VTELDETLFEGEFPEPTPLNNDAQLTDEEFCETFFKGRVLKWFKTLQPSTVARYKGNLSEFCSSFFDETLNISTWKILFN
jgi:hypothetical protein